MKINKKKMKKNTHVFSRTLYFYMRQWNNESFSANEKD